MQKQGFLHEHEQLAYRATVELRDFVDFRINWVSDRVIMFRPNADPIISFSLASYRYRLRPTKGASDSYKELSEDGTHVGLVPG